MGLVLFLGFLMLGAALGFAAFVHGGVALVFIGLGCVSVATLATVSISQRA